jgi:hypothetical protein
MDTLEQVADLKRQAVELLLAERERIDAELAIFTDKKDPSVKRRGRPPRLPEQVSSPTETTLPAGS